MEVDWDDALLRMHKSTSLINDNNGAPIFNGLRVRMGIHSGIPFPIARADFLTCSLTGVPDFCARDETSKRMDYFGPAMNLAARVGGAGSGGQIVFSSQAAKGTYFARVTTKNK